MSIDHSSNGRHSQYTSLLKTVSSCVRLCWVVAGIQKQAKSWFITESSCVSMTHVPMPTRHLLKAVSLRPALLSFCVLGSSKLLQWKHMQVYKCYVATFTQKCLEPILRSSDVQTWKQGKSQLWRALKGSHVDPHFSKNCPSATMSGQSGTVCECVCVCKTSPSAHSSDVDVSWCFLIVLGPSRASVWLAVFCVSSRVKHS